MYINRKTGELIHEQTLKELKLWEDKNFQEQYGEAMVNPLGTIHAKDNCCEKGYCIPYISEQKDPDEGLEVRPEIIERLEKSKQIPKEELLTSEQMREKLGIGQSNLMLSDKKLEEEVKDIITNDKYTKAEKAWLACNKSAQAELAHLKGLGIVYVKTNVKMKLTNSSINTVQFIPLSDYKGQL